MHQRKALVALLAALALLVSACGDAETEQGSEIEPLEKNFTGVVKN